MNFAILNKTGSKISDLSEVRLLWTAMLFSDKVIYATPLNTLMTANVIFRRQPERSKIDVIKLSLESGNEKFNPEEFEKFYQHYLALKKVKHKSRDMIIHLKMGEKILNGLEDKLLEGNKKVLELLKINELQPFVWNNDENIIIPTLVSDNDPRPKEKRSINYFETLSAMLTEDDVLPMLDDSFFNDELDIDCCIEKLLSIPAPESLTESQVRIIRKDFREKFNCFKGCEDYKQRLKEKPYSEYIIQTDGTEAPPYKEKDENSEFQKSIDENIYIENLRQNSTDGIVYELFEGVTSFEDLIKAYNYLGILTEEDALYAKENVSRKVNLKNTTIFFFLKTRNNTTDDKI